MAPIDLLDTGLPQSFNLQNTQHLGILWNAICLGPRPGVISRLVVYHLWINFVLLIHTWAFYVDVDYPKQAEFHFSEGSFSFSEEIDAQFLSQWHFSRPGSHNHIYYSPPPSCSIHSKKECGINGAMFFHSSSLYSAPWLVQLSQK